MDNKFISPVIQKNTPIKRLGLSRKRKSCGSSDIFANKIQACGNDSSLSIKTSLNVTVQKTTQINNEENVENNQANLVEIEYYEKEITSIKLRISEKEDKLNSLKSKKNIENLENLTEIWKKGCKKAYLHFVEVLKDKQEVSNINTILKRLGIFKTLSDNFENDSDISLSDCSQ